MNYPSDAPIEISKEDTHGLYLIVEGQDALLIDTYPSWHEAAMEALRRTLDGADGEGSSYRAQRLEVESET